MPLNGEKCVIRPQFSTSKQYSLVSDVSDGNRWNAANLIDRLLSQLCHNRSDVFFPYPWEFNSTLTYRYSSPKLRNYPSKHRPTQVCALLPHMPLTNKVAKCGRREVRAVFKYSTTNLFI
ncbi:hypothetical protein AB6A40_002246 [Gnathostoma spinigerum]|uniref:Uncharacterized protein n=1 Tax=Gnathostoma spinigerum TaxID=75299 RepID=A0ABD6E8B3_9BILA